MAISRRTFVAAAFAITGTSTARAEVTDATGRSLSVPEKVERVFPAGPPAAILLYTLAPDLLLGWPRANRPEECAYMLPDICVRPEVGRITGRGKAIHHAQFHKLDARFRSAWSYSAAIQSGKRRRRSRDRGGYW